MNLVTRAKTRETKTRFFDKGQITIIDIVFFMLLSATCYLLFQQGDLIVTANSSYAYLDGHITDFYSSEVATAYGWPNVYMPTIYLLFAVWNLPLKVLGFIPTASTSLPFIGIMWAKLMTTLFFAGSALLVYQIAISINMGEKKARIACYAFLSAPIAFFEQFIFGQYNEIMIFFSLLGILFLLKEKNLLAYLFFGLAITCKYFAACFILPILLLREKNPLKLMGQILIIIVPFAAEVLFYFRAPGFVDSVFNSSIATGYINKTVINTASVPLQLVIITFIFICAWAFFTQSQTLKERVYWVLFFDSLVMFSLFGLSSWHPQWLAIYTPIFIFSVLTSRNANIFWLLDMLYSVVYFIIIVNLWAGNVDQSMLTNGILRCFYSFTPESLANMKLMKDLYPFNDISMLFSVLSALLLVFSVFKHPRYQQVQMNDLSNCDMCYIRTRFILPVLFFVVSALLCLPSMID